MYFVYLLTNKPKGVFYIGITNDLVKRMTEHRLGIYDGFTKRYAIHQLVYFECYDDAEVAIRRERRLKKWSRDWKIEMVEKKNMEWVDLYNAVVEICAQREEEPRVRSLRSLSGEWKCTQ